MLGITKTETFNEVAEDSPERQRNNTNYLRAVKPFTSWTAVRR
jgi:hypothetical protein